MKTKFILASVMAVLFLAAPNKAEAQRKVAGRSFEQYAVTVLLASTRRPISVGRFAYFESFYGAEHLI